jgi:prepilin-type N-terminal cleavage/methylation domain-containing protein
VAHEQQRKEISMNDSWNSNTRQARRGLTLPELLVTIAVLGTLGCLVLARRSPAPTILTSRPALEAPAPALPPGPGGEMSLQETLDRLGYTVNVPRSFQGRRLTHPGSYRVSSGDDTLAAEWFEGDGAVQLQELCRQSAYGSWTHFGAMTAGEERIPLLTPSARCGVYSSGAGPGRAMESGLTGAASFFIEYGFGGPPVRLSSVASANPGGSPKLIVLPARTGGAWIEDGDRSGHWEGGEETGDYLLCWEDLPQGDNDFQDLVVLVRGIRPASSGSR